MNIFYFEAAILAAIKSYIDTNLSSIKNYVAYYDYEPALEEIDIETLRGAVAVYVRDTTFPIGSQNGNWQAESIIEIDCFGFSESTAQVVEGKNVLTPASKLANINCKAILTASFMATTNRETLRKAFSAKDGSGKDILIGSKEPTDIKLFTQEDLHSSKIAMCVRKYRITVQVLETTDQASSTGTLREFDSIIESYNNNNILRDGDEIVESFEEAVGSFGSVVTG